MSAIQTAQLATAPRAAAEAHSATSRELYLELLKKCLTRYVFPQVLYPLKPRPGTFRHLVFRRLEATLARKNLVLARQNHFDPEVRARGADFPIDAETMIGLNRLNNLQACIADVLRRDVPGDFIETGVWRGGATIFMRAMLAAYGDTTRIVWAADSFEGQPKPDPAQFPNDADDGFWTMDIMKVSLDEVQANFARYDMLDHRVRFLVGWFKDTLPTAPIERLAILRLDGDLYESTYQALEALYPKLSPGGYAIVDDYVLPACRAAVEDYRAKHGIHEPITTIEWTGAYWQRSH
jgi:O-methyltransferase